MRTTAHCSGIVIITSLLALSACGKSDEVTLGDFGEQASSSTCDKVYECCLPTEKPVVEHMNYSGGRAECGSKTRSALGFWAAVIAQEQQRGRLRYDGKLARRCLDAYAAATCEAHKSDQPLDGCDSFIVPLTPPGSACGMSESCMGGTCVGATEAQEGTCRTHAAEGESCASSACSKGLFCGSGKICQRRLASGQSCRIHGECQSGGCNGLENEGATSGTCGPKGGEQTRCFVTTGCAYGGGTGGGMGLLALLGLVGAAAASLRRRRRTAIPGVTSRRC
jgi:hypothetical protein